MPLAEGRQVALVAQFLCQDEKIELKQYVGKDKKETPI